MPVAAFEPKFMKIGVLTAALQELTPREMRDPDPDRAIEEWLEFARELGADYIELSAALHPDEGRRAGRGHARPGREHARSAQAHRPRAGQPDQRGDEAHGVGLSDLGYFDNMLHEDPAIRRKKHDFMLRVMDAAVAARGGRGVRFRGPQPGHSIGPEPRRFREELHSAAEVREGAAASSTASSSARCPAGRPKDNFHNNIGYTPGMWIASHRICEKHGVGDQLPHPLRPVARHPDGPGHPLASSST